MAFGVIVLVINAGVGYVYAGSIKVGGRPGVVVRWGVEEKGRRCLQRYIISGESVVVAQIGWPLVCACMLYKSYIGDKTNLSADFLLQGRRP